MYISSPSIANSGPWKQIQKFKAECVGSEDMNDPGMLLVDPWKWRGGKGCDDLMVMQS